MKSLSPIVLALSTGVILGIVAMPFLPKGRGAVTPSIKQPVVAPAPVAAPLSPAAAALAKAACVDSVDGFMAALSSGKRSQYEDFLTSAAALGLESEEGLALDGSGIEVFEVGAAQLVAGEGLVPVAMSIRGQMQYLDLHLRKEGGLWSIYGASLKLGDETTLIDFEHGSRSLGSITEDMLKLVASTIDDDLEQDADALASGEPSYAGQGPVTLEFVDFVDRTDPQFTRIEVRIQNDSNRAIDKVEASFHYLDEAGHELDSFPHALSGPVGFNGQAVLALAGAEKVNNVTAFFMPEGTVDVSIEVLKVLFEDQSTWPSK